MRSAIIEDKRRAERVFMAELGGMGRDVTLEEMLQDIHALEESLFVFERKYGVLSETFYESYQRGEEPEDDAWVLDWSEWAGTYRTLLERRERYRQAVRSLLKQPSVANLAHLIGKTARRESLAVSP